MYLLSLQLLLLLQGPVCDQSLATISTPVDVLRKHSAKLSKIISTPDSLASHLNSKDLISDEVLDEILSTLGLSRQKKVLIILSEVRCNLMNGDQFHKFNILCQTLSEIQSTDVMRKIVSEMERDIENMTDDK